MKRKFALYWRSRVIHRGMVHWVSRSSGGRTPRVVLECEMSNWERGLDGGPWFRWVPDVVQFTGRDVDCAACIAARIPL